MTEEEAFAIMDFLDELKQYRAIGLTPKMVKDMIESEKLASHATIIRGAELELYQTIGTVEEFKALKEKNEPKKPIDLSTVKDGDSYYYIGRCPRCKDLVSEDDIVCEECHQVLDWS